MKKYVIECLDNNDKYVYMATDEVEALEKHRFYLNLICRDITSFIKELSKCYYLKHNGLTYGIVKR